jgi:hypothetical protein
MASLEHLEQKAAQLRAEALGILEGGVMGLLEAQFGKIHVVGSVALDLMTWPDMDLFCHLEHSERAKLIGLAPLLSEQLEQQGYSLANISYNDEYLRPDPKFPDSPGLYGGYQFLQRGTGVLWKMDFWGWTQADYFADIIRKAELAKRLETADRKLILELKSALHHHPEYRKTVYSIDIYNFALEQAGSTLEDFWHYLEKR